MTGDTQKVSCVFVHGWGMNATIWQPVLEKLPDWVEATAIDLPGHGQRTEEMFSDLQSLTADLQQQCEQIKNPAQPLILIGWSLGGLPCLQLAIEQSKLMDALLLVSSNPCFVSQANGDTGIDGEVFNQFARSLKRDFSGTIRRFLSLQVKGSDTGREILRSLREKILQQPQPNEVSLNAGLNILLQVDLREQLQYIRQPLSWVLGGQDSLVKSSLAKTLNKVWVVEKAGHAPFLSHTDEFIQQLLMQIKNMAK